MAAMTTIAGAGRQLAGRIGRAAFLIAAPLLLASCFLSPGRFAADMNVGDDGGFSFAYKGELVVGGFSDALKRRGGYSGDQSETDEKCYGTPPDQADGGAGLEDEVMGNMQAPVATVPAPPPVVTVPPPVIAAPGYDERPCTKQEKQERADARVAEAKRKREEALMVERAIGFNPEDEASLRRFAAALSKQAGWKSVVYKGNGVFMVDYAVSGRLDRDFVWPVFPATGLSFPMVLAQRQTDGRVRVSAPGFGFAGGGGGPAMMRMLGGFGPGGFGGSPDSLPPIDGSFTITTSSEILTNNTEDGPVADPAGRKLLWKIKPLTAAAPEALLKPGR